MTMPITSTASTISASSSTTRARRSRVTRGRRRSRCVFEGADGYPATARLSELPDAIRIGGIDVQIVDQPHGSITSAGLRFEAGGKSVGYATDFHQMTSEMRTLYKDLDLLVIDALRRRPHPTHPHLAEVLGWADELAPKRALLTHMDNSMDYRTLLAELPDGVEPAYDNQEVVL
jgi:phosphoribosyl 1,2-cyclic phosphate phosphodiesterase